MRRIRINRGRSVAGWRGRSVCARIAALLHRGESGNALIEMAFALPLLLMVMTGIWSFGLYVYNAMLLEQAVSAGAQYAQEDVNSSSMCTDVLGAVKLAAPSLANSNLSMTLTVLSDSGTGNGGATSCSSSTITQADTNNMSGAPVAVTATYPCKLPIYSFSPSCKLSTTVTEYGY